MGGIACVIVWSLIGLSCSWAMSSLDSLDLASSVSFPLTYIDAESSLVRSVEADPADLPKSMPMRRFVAAGRALRVRIEKQRKPLNIRGKLSYEGDLVGDFYLTVPVGTPPQHVIFLADTGSEFSWSQCSPCTLCSGTRAPLFAFNKSSSFLSVPCDSVLCRSSLGLDAFPCNGSSTSDGRTTCKFAVAYGDGSQDVGFVAVDSFSLTPHFSKPIIFGCATYVLDTVPTPSSGLLGLSAGPFSFPSQLFSGSTHIPNKFAHCLPDRLEHLDTPGTINFGNYELPASLRYTPFVPPYSPLGNVYYYVDLQAITVGESWIKAAAMKAQKGAPAVGGTIFDSGSAVTKLVKPVYDKLVKEMKRQTAHLHPFASKSHDLDLCYKVSPQAKELPNMPMVVLRFAGNVDLELGPGSLLYAAGSDGKSITLCLAFDSGAPSDTENVIGNYQQQNYWVEYNLHTSSLGLAKAQPACAK